MPRLLPFVAAAVLAASPVAAARGGGAANQLIRIVSPAVSGPVAAHPFVNVIVALGSAKGVDADPTTFRARLGRVNVTPLFTAIEENGKIIRMHGEIGPALLRVGRGRSNRLRLEVLSQAGRRGRFRDVDQFRFRATDTTDQPPVARAIADSDVILPGIPLHFDGTKSDDPESDRLNYHWDFGDGTTSTEPRPSHTFDATGTDVTVKLTVDDGQLNSSNDMTLLELPPLDPGRTPGMLRIDADAALEFSAVAPGTTPTRVFTVHNTDETATSQLRVRLGLAGDGFALDHETVDLGPGESTDVTLAFTPGPTAGHHAAELTLVASASNRRVIHLLGHAYGGVGEGTGPSGSSDIAFYNTLGRGTYGILPSGARFFADNTAHLCQAPPGSFGTGDFCLTDADCINGGTCPTTGTCIRGDRAGQPCGTITDCPLGFCSSAVPFDPADMCGDGQGGLFVLSDEGGFTDPNQERDTLLASSILRLQFDANGVRTVAAITAHTTESTNQLACDGIAADAGGRLYLPEFHNVEAPGDCFRDGREALVAFRKGGADSSTILGRIDAVEGLNDCDDTDTVTDIEMTRDGSAIFVSLPGIDFDTGGIYRIRPTGLRILQDFDDVFQVHPDGSVIVGANTDEGARGVLRIYKLSPEQAQHGAAKLADLTPCATVTVPNNRTPETRGNTSLRSLAVGRTAANSADGIALLSFSTPTTGVLSSTLSVQGTFAVSSPAGTNTCTVLGLVNLEPLDQLTF